MKQEVDQTRIQNILKEVESMSLPQLRLLKDKIDSEAQLLLHPIELNQDRVCKSCGAKGLWMGHEDPIAAQYIMMCECGFEQVID